MTIKNLNGTQLQVGEVIDEGIFEDKGIYITDIDSESAESIIKAIIKINNKDNASEKEKNGFVREPINIYVNSYGGCAYSMLSIINAIENSKTPVHTHCIGVAYSAGLGVFLAGHKRIGYRYSSVMYHSVRGWASGDIKEIEEDLELKKKLQNKYDDIITRKTNITQETLADKVENKIDWFIFAEDFEKLKIADDIIKND